MTVDSPVEILANFMDAVHRKDARACANSFLEDGVMHTPCVPSPHPKSTRGREQIGQVFDFLFKHVLKQFQWTDLEIHATDDAALVFARARSKAELVSGKPYDNEYAIFARVSSGRLAEYTEFFDTERAVKAFEGLT